MQMIDAFWNQLLGYKAFKIEFEEGLKHQMSCKGLARMWEFFFGIIETK